MAQIKLALGLNRVAPIWELIQAQDGFIECTKLQNYIARDKKITKIGGTEAYNPIQLPENVPWVHRSYHKRGDGSFRKVMFCYSDGQIYYGDDVARTFTSAQAGFNKEVIPMHVTFQVSGNSILYFISGEDEIYKYDGNGSFQWEKTTINEDIGRTVVQAAAHLDRVWYVSKDSSTLAYSTTLKPEDLSTDAGDIVVGQETDSVIRAVIVGANETLYIFKNNSIWQLFGRTPSTFQFRKITDKYGLATKRTVYPVGSGFVFWDELSKELHFFGGTEASITPLTEDEIRLRDIIDQTPHEIQKAAMTVHRGLFRFAFKHREDNQHPDRELIYAVNDPRPDGKPRWSMSKGAKVMSYSTWQLQGDRNELVTGHSEYGKVMYHNRTNNFDGGAIETIVRTGEVVASEDKAVRFDGFKIQATPGPSDAEPLFRYFMDGRISDRGEKGLDMEGETRAVGEFKLQKQDLFNTRIIPLSSYSRGNSISFEIYDNSLDTFLEFGNISFTARDRYRIRNSKSHRAP
jgi:hypothetical protein